MSDQKYKVEIKKLDGSEIEITGEISSEELGGYRSGVVKELSNSLEIDGFRKGHIPENVLLKHVSEEQLLHEMSKEAISNAYPTIIEENKLDVIGRPDITITKIAAGNPLGFKIRTAIMPEIKLPDYKKIAKEVMNEKEEEIITTDEDVEKVITDIRRRRVEPKEGEPKTEDKDLPELTDEDAKSLGKFESVNDLKSKIKENLTEEKKYHAAEKKRLGVMDKIVGGMEMIMPQILVESELDKMVAEMRHEVERMGLKFEDYLTHLKKSVEDMKKDWAKDAERRVKFSLAIDEIANLEKLSGTAQEIEHEIKHMLEHYPEANPLSVKNYVEAMIRHNKVFEWLEEQGDKKPAKKKENACADGCGHEH